MTSLDGPWSADASLGAFLDAVSRHVTFGLGADPLAADDDGVRVRDARAVALRVLRDAGALDLPADASTLDAAARRLLADPPMLAAFFQNLDLLDAGPRADAVALLLMRAMEL